jgi:hypothetical protein
VSGPNYLARACELKAEQVSKSFAGYSLERRMVIAAALGRIAEIAPRVTAEAQFYQHIARSALGSLASVELLLADGQVDDYEHQANLTQFIVELASMMDPPEPAETADTEPPTAPNTEDTSP